MFLDDAGLRFLALILVAMIGNLSCASSGAKINVRQYTRYLEEVGPPCGPWDKPLGDAQAH